jgi:hypothetical protein
VKSNNASMNQGSVVENSQPKYQSVLKHCREIERCNQRGGRMLSIVDLVEAGTLTRELAAYCLAAIGGGASFLIGALPGGAGKTTVMGALLNFVPAGVRLVPADGIESIELGMKAPPSARRCFICHEIGSGPYYAYLWGEELRQYFCLAGAGHLLATNLHADTYEQAHEQICGTNGVPESALRRMNLMFFLSVGRQGRGKRRIEEVWESDGRQAHRRIYDASAPTRPVGPSLLVSDGALASARAVTDALLACGVRTIQEVRARILRGR